jgi:hypothetical protein
MDSIKSKLNGYWEYMRLNKEEVIVYLFLFIGIFSLFFNPVLGEFILGILSGLYFYFELVYFIQNAREMYQRSKIRYVVLMGLILSLLIFLPTFVITTVIVAAIRQLFSKN